MRAHRWGKSGFESCRSHGETMSEPAATPAREPLARMLDFVRTALMRSAEEVRSISAGLVITAPALPTVWSVNQLRVTEPLDFDALIELADRELAGTGYRHVVVEHQASGPELEVAFRQAGWKVERDLLMVLADGPDRGGDTSVVVDAGEDEVMDVMRRWHLEDADPIPDEDETTQLVEYNRREGRAQAARLLGVRSSDGQLVAIAQLRSDGSTAQVEDVFTVPEARGRGYARAMLTRAIELARAAEHELIFIIADDQDWPKLLYRRIGFRPVGHIWQFHRK
jgi:GNAT superfamily N-acetyltransferase